MDEDYLTLLCPRLVQYPLPSSSWLKKFHFEFFKVFYYFFLVGNEIHFCIIKAFLFGSFCFLNLVFLLKCFFFQTCSFIIKTTPLKNKKTTRKLIKNKFFKKKKNWSEINKWNVQGWMILTSFRGYISLVLKKFDFNFSYSWFFYHKN